MAWQEVKWSDIFDLALVLNMVLMYWPYNKEKQGNRAKGAYKMNVDSSKLRECYNIAKDLKKQDVAQLSQPERRAMVVALRALRKGASHVIYKNDRVFSGLPTKLYALKDSPQRSPPFSGIKKWPLLFKTWRVFAKFLARIASALGIWTRSKTVWEEIQKANDEISRLDTKERIADIISLLRGERMDLTPENLEGTGDTPVMAPTAFAKDLHRSDEFSINGTCYFKKGNTGAGQEPAAVGRELYRLLGERGAARVMQVCHQGIMAGVLKRLFRDTLPNWTKSHPAIEGLVPHNESKFVFNVRVDSEQNLVEISTKVAMGMTGSLRPPLKNDPQFVVRVDIAIPLDELQREDFDTVDDPAPNLFIREVVSKLVINDRDAAQKLFEAY